MLFGLVSELTWDAKISKIGDISKLLSSQGTLHHWLWEFTLGDVLPSEVEHFATCKRKAVTW